MERSHYVSERDWEIRLRSTMVDDNDTSGRRRAVNWAKAYPFDRPTGSYVYVDGRAFDLFDHSFDDFAEADVEIDGKKTPLASLVKRERHREQLDMAARYAVVASGSNGAPERLRQKFGDDNVVIPTLRVRVSGFCVIYAAKFTSYGSVPSTLAHTPGAHVWAWVNLLTREQLARMDETETLGRRYNRVRLGADAVTTENGAALAHAEAYVSQHGGLVADDHAVTPVPIGGGVLRHRVLDQSQTQELVKSLLDVSGTIDDFIYENIADPALRQRRSAFLRENHSIPLDVPLATSGDMTHDRETDH